jgi:hypothetical protein
MTAERAPLPYDWGEIRTRLQGDLTALLDRLNLKHDLPGPGDGRRIFPINPMRADRKAGSFVIWKDADRKGAWKDYATGAQGDVFDLIAGVEGLRSKIDTYWWAVDFLNLDRQGRADAPRRRGAIAAEQERRRLDHLAAEAKAREDDEANSAHLFALWLTLPPIAGTPAEHYLRHARGLPLERLRAMPGALRWAEHVEYVNQTTGEVKTWRHVMVSAMTRGSAVVGLHRTYLKPDGSGKADMAKPKLMIGPVRGAAIRLASGPSGLSPSAAAKVGRRDPLAIGEGIETCLTAACVLPHYRVWAAGSLSFMGLLDWPECASAVVLMAENDYGAGARAAFARVEAHWRKLAKGRPVFVVASAVGSDFNDWARAG